MLPTTSPVLRTLSSLLLIVGMSLWTFGCAAPPIETTDRVDAATFSWQEKRCFDVTHLAAEEQALADSLMKEALDHQALYTLVGDIKPMSTLQQKRLFVARPDSLPAGIPDVITTDTARAAHADAAQLQRVAQALSCGEISTVVVPFRITRDGVRTVQALLVNQRRIDEVMQEKRAFWGQWGFAPGVAPGVVTTTVEYENSLDRFRGYGHLFGYPAHAVTFFVEAARESEATGEFVERDFFHIPTHAAETNRFTYAVPEGYMPTAVDSAVYLASRDVLSAYRERRDAYVTSEGTLQALELVRDWYREEPARDPRRPTE